MRICFFIASICMMFFIPFFDASAKSKTSEVIPVTVGDIKKYRDDKEDGFWDFVQDFYKKNKEIGATDGQILNELLKFDVTDGENSEYVKKLSLLGKRFKSMEGFFDRAVDEINLDILERYPGQTNRLIKANDMSTWKNIKYVTVSGVELNVLIKALSEKEDYSKPVVTENSESMLVSCMDRGQGKILMALIAMPKDKGLLVRQKEGDAFFNYDFDFSNSENLDFGDVNFPFEKKLNLNGQNVFGYDTVTYFPFYAQVVDKDKQSVVRLNYNVNVCKDKSCSLENVTGLEFEVKKNFLEAASCPNLVQKEFNLPKNNNANIDLVDVYFQKDTTNKNNVNLYVSADLPFASKGKTSLIVLNQDGLKFSETFLTRNENREFFKLRLLNPEKLKGKSDLILRFKNGARHSEFKKEVHFKSNFLAKGFFSFSALFTSFFLGLKFYFLTPVFSAFMLFLYQSFFVSGKSSEKMVSFYNGLGKLFYFILPFILIVFFICRYFLPQGSLFWGMQFNFPLLNFFFILTFIFVALNMNKVFDNDFVEKVAKNTFGKLRFLNLSDNREKAGFFVGLVLCVLLCLTPMIGLYYQIYLLLSKSFIIYSIVFSLGVCFLFIALGLFDEKAEEVDSVSKDFSKKFRAIFTLPIYFQAVCLFVLLAMQAGRSVMILAFLLIAIITIFLIKKPFLSYKKAIAGLLLCSAFLIPLKPNDYNMNNYGKMDFDEQKLYDYVQQGKVVYLNVTESFCITCQWNRWVMMYFGARDYIADDKLIVMGIDYNNPFLYQLLAKSYQHTLPMNLIFSPIDPEGSVLPTVLNPLKISRTVAGKFPKEKPSAEVFKQKIDIF